MNHQETSKIEQFERVIVFRSARFLPLLLSVIATLMLGVAAIALLYSIVPSWKPGKPGSVPEPPQVSVNGADITSYLNRIVPVTPAGNQVNTSPQPGNAAQRSNFPAAPVASTNAVLIANEMDAIRKRAVTLKLPWANEYQTVCQQVIFGNCYDQRTVMATRGVSGYIDQAFSHHNDSYAAIETVPVGDQSYRVNPSQYLQKMTILRELESVLASAQPDDARKLIGAWGKIREDRERERERALRIEEEKREMEYAKAQLNYQATVERKHAVRRASFGVVGLALGSFVLLGLILAVLAVERNTRLLEAQLRAAPLSASVPSPLLCKNCNLPLDAGATFCDECGAKVS